MGHKAVPLLIFWGSPILFSTVAISACIPTNSSQGFFGAGSMRNVHRSLLSILPRCLEKERTVCEKRKGLSSSRKLLLLQKNCFENKYFSILLEFSVSNRKKQLDFHYRKWNVTMSICFFFLLRAIPMEFFLKKCTIFYLKNKATQKT